MNWSHGTLRERPFSDDAALDFSGLVRGTFYLLDSSPDVVLAHDQFTAFAALGYSILRRRPYAVYMHEGLLEDPNRALVHLSPRGRKRVRKLSSFITRATISSAKMILCNTHETRLSVERALKRPPPMEVLFPGAPIVSSRNGDPRENLVLALSTWDAGRHPALYREVAIRTNKGTLVLAGAWRFDNKEQQRLFEEESKDAISSGRFVVTGPLNEGRLESLYSRAKVFLRFGIDEFGPGMGCLRALSWGVPIITNKGMGIASIVKAYDCGIVIETPDPAEAAAVIREILTSPDQWLRLHQNALKAASALSWSAHNDRLQQTLQRMGSNRLERRMSNAGRLLRELGQ